MRDLKFYRYYISCESFSPFDLLPLTYAWSAAFASAALSVLDAYVVPPRFALRALDAAACSALAVALTVTLLAGVEEGAALLSAQFDKQCSARRGAAKAGGREQRAPCGATLTRGTEALALAARVAVLLIMASCALYSGIADHWGAATGRAGDGVGASATRHNETRALAARARDSTLWVRPSGATPVMANVLFAFVAVSALARGWFVQPNRAPQRVIR